VPDESTEGRTTGLFDQPGEIAEPVEDKDLDTEQIGDQIGLRSRCMSGWQNASS
jgi:hypothetical protein